MMKNKSFLKFLPNDIDYNHKIKKIFVSSVLKMYNLKVNFLMEGVINEY
jgi:hypothetical protein